MAAAEDAVRGQDAVVHLAAIPKSFVIDGPEVVRVNMTSVYNVAEACRRARVGKVIYAGSDSGLGLGIRAVNRAVAEPGAGDRDLAAGTPSDHCPITVELRI